MCDLVTISRYPDRVFRMTGSCVTSVPRQLVLVALGLVAACEVEQGPDPFHELRLLTPDRLDQLPLVWVEPLRLGVGRVDLRVRVYRKGADLIGVVCFETNVGFVSDLFGFLLVVEWANFRFFESAFDGIRFKNHSIDNAWILKAMLVNPYW